MGYFSSGVFKTEEGHTVPSFLSRLASASVDMAISLSLMIGTFFLSYPFGYFPTIGDAIRLKDASDKLHEYQLSSFLYTDENDVITYIAKDDFQGYEKIIQDYYFIYQQSSNDINPSPKNYSIQDYNHNILSLPLTTDFVVESPYFEFDTDEFGEPDASKIGVIRQSLYEDGKLKAETLANLKYYFQRRYDEAVVEFNAESYVVSASKRVTELTVYIELISVLPSFLIFYVAIPLANEKRKTIGKMIMRQALVDAKGNKLKWYFVLARSSIFILGFIVASIMDDLIASIAILGTLLLVSLGFVTFTQKRRALHDYVGHSLVVKDDGTVVFLEKKDGKENR